MIVNNPEKYGLPKSWFCTMYTEPGQYDELGDDGLDYDEILNEIKEEYPEPFELYNISIVDLEVDYENSECVVDAESMLTDRLGSEDWESFDDTDIPLFDEYEVPIYNIIYELNKK